MSWEALTAIASVVSAVVVLVAAIAALEDIIALAIVAAGGDRGASKHPPSEAPVVE